LSAYYYKDVFILMKRLFAFFALRLDYLWRASYGYIWLKDKHRLDRLLWDIHNFN
jgi:hypothetical protein